MDSIINKKFYLICFVSIFFLFLIFSPIALAGARNLGDWGTVLNETAGTAGAGYNTDLQDPDPVIAKIIQIILSLLGIIFLILMVYGGFLWMTAAGNEDRVTKSKNLITAAVIGLIIVLAAYAVSAFIISKLSANTLR